jgi:branched-chain amino acid transport system substrate-binding protein
VHGLGLKAAQGLILTTSFYWDMDEKTREWSKRFFAKRNAMPTMWQAGVYSAVMNYLRAIDKTGTDEPLKVGSDALLADRGLSAQWAVRTDGLMVHDLVLAGEEAGVALSLTIIGARAHSGDQAFPAGSRLRLAKN